MTTNFNVPQIIQDIPPVHSVACGYAHTCIITNMDLWSCGFNNHGQLCLGNKENQTKFQQTLFSDILKLSLGYAHTLFENSKGEIFSCGYNGNGELELGCSDDSIITPTLIPNLPPKIIQFVCGIHQSLFLDVDGNVFSVGRNSGGSLGHELNQNGLMKIPNIPPIQLISYVGNSGYLVDFEGNVWNFGIIKRGQLGHGDTENRIVPTKTSLKIFNNFLMDVLEIIFLLKLHI